ncbi:MAG: UvrABC system protein [Candidatus Nomurabacteria bacterium]|nr:UvrABC system protein [Candidatus Nomurabacteria bacterium]
MHLLQVPEKGQVFPFDIITNPCCCTVDLIGFCPHIRLLRRTSLMFLMILWILFRLGDSTAAGIYYTMFLMKKQDCQKLKLPENPGVYFFRDKDKNILYIGKATSLKDRVASYFNPDLMSRRGLRMATMVTIADNVTFQQTESVLEALLLESKFIKEHQPPYNAKEKDDKSFPCVVITKEEFPRVLVMRIRDYEKKFEKKGILTVYGPFPSMSQLKDAMKIIRRLFPYHDRCDACEDKKECKPCFNAQIGLCPGVCIGAISKVEYKGHIDNIRRLFEGKRTEIKRELEKDMSKYAKEHEFEKAAKVRNTLYALDHIRDTSLIKEEDVLSFKDQSFRIEAYDVAHISGSHRVGTMVVMEGKEKAKDQYRRFKLEEKVNDDYEGLRQILLRRFNHKEWRYPDLIVIDGGVGHKQTADKVLAHLNLHIPTVSVVKDDRHKPKDILGDKVHVDNHKKEILLANSEAHRFSIGYHRTLRNRLI